MDSTLLRNLVFEALARIKEGTSTDIREEVARLAWERQHCTADDSQTKAQLFNDVQSIIWDLISQGLLRPGQRFEPGVSGQAEGLPWLTVTPHGTKCFAQKGYVPYDADGYLAKLRNDAPSIDPVALMYLGEALATFRSHNYLAAAVMVGVASEKLIVVLRDAVANALDSPNKKQSFEDATKGRVIKVQYEEVRKRMVGKLDPSMEEAVRVHLDGIFNLIRVCRNDAGHPTGRRIERDEILASLYAFPLYCRTLYSVVGWLATHKI